MEEQTYWSIDTEQDTPVLRWNCTRTQDHTDFLEMSGLYASFIVTYGVCNGKAFFRRHPVFPMLRTFPNDTKSSYQTDVEETMLPTIRIDGVPLSEHPACFRLNGTVECTSVCATKDGHVALIRRFFPTTDQQAVCETLSLSNQSDAVLTLSLDGPLCRTIECVLGPMGLICATVHTTIDGRAISQTTVPPHGTVCISHIYSGHLGIEPDPGATLDVSAAYDQRMTRVKALMNGVKLNTGNTVLETLYAFSQLRAGESIFRTKNGDVHCPGGGAYYAAVWCNDQAEYAGPWQAYTGDALQQNAAYNAYAWYYPYMGASLDPIPSSVIAEGTSYWNGRGDRGDAAMYLYGACRYALTCGNLGPDRRLWNAILWCAEYCLSKKDKNGVIASDCDELENRLPAGDANLCTSMLALGGLRLASRIALALGDTTHARRFDREANALQKAAESHFAANIHGFDTYRYYDGNTTLRSWICMPLCMDLTAHADGTVAALLSDCLMSDAGQLSEEGGTISWDRSTLYGLRGIFRVGRGDRAFDTLERYCRQRLLGAHVPYPVEAWPEGGRRQLSAESALFCQIITEGMLAIDPLSFRSFSFVPQLPDALDHLIVSDLHGFTEVFSIGVTRREWWVETVSGKRFSGTSRERQIIAF